MSENRGYNAATKSEIIAELRGQKKAFGSGVTAQSHFELGIQHMNSMNNSLPYSSFSSSYRRDADGRRGLDGANGSSGSYSGSDGHPGQAGQRGHDANNIIISLIPVPRTDAYMIVREKFETSIMRLYATSEIRLSAAGGDGGNGGRGGDGARGVDGRNGYSPGSSGGDGGNGGNGGNGGRGGDGGNGGHIQVITQDENSDLLYSVDLMNVSGGCGGKGGRGGNGGSGGSGGSPGPAVVTTHRDGDRVYTTSHSGSYGSSGFGGSGGSRGSDGTAGTDGIKEYCNTSDALGFRTYSSLFTVKLQEIGVVYSATGLIEPRQIVRFDNFRVLNNEKMSAPADRINLSLQNSPSFTVLNRGFLINTVLYQGKVYHLSNNNHYFSCQIHKFGIVHSSAFRFLIPIDFEANLPRVQRVIPGFDNKGSLSHNYSELYGASDITEALRGYRRILVAFPLELSFIRGQRTILPNGQSVVTFKLRNQSSIPMGSKSSMGVHTRKVFVKISCRQEYINALKPTFQPMLPSRALSLVTPSTVEMKEYFLQPTGYSLLEPVVFEIEYLAPGEEIVLGGVISIGSHWQALHRKIYVDVALEIDAVYNEAEATHDKTVNMIQQYTHEIQVAQEALPLRENQLLLLTNYNIGPDIIYYYKQVANLLGMEFNEWNISLYKGFGYNETLCPVNRTFYDKLALVVILNVKFTCDDYDNDVFSEKDIYPLDYLGTSELFEACRMYGIRTHVVNLATDNRSFVQSKKLNSPDNLMVPVMTKLATTGIGTNHGIPLPIFPYQALPFTSTDTPILSEDPSVTFDDINLGVQQLLRKPVTFPETYDAKPLDSIYINLRKTTLIRSVRINDLTNQGPSVYRRLKHTRADHQFFLFQHYQGLKICRRYCIFTQYSCGQFEIRRGLDRLTAIMSCQDILSMEEITKSAFTPTSIAKVEFCATLTENNPNDNSEEIIPCLKDVTILIKLLPFPVKLERLLAFTSDCPMYHIYFNQLVSDLVDEQMAYYTHTPHWMKSKDLRKSLPNLTYFKKYDFTSYFQINGAESELKVENSTKSDGLEDGSLSVKTVQQQFAINTIKHLLGKFRSFLRHISSIWTFFSFTWARRRQRKVVKEILTLFWKQYFYPTLYNPSEDYTLKLPMPLPTSEIGLSTIYAESQQVHDVVNAMYLPKDSKTSYDNTSSKVENNNNSSNNKAPKIELSSNEKVNSNSNKSEENNNDSSDDDDVDNDDFDDEHTDKVGVSKKGRADSIDSNDSDEINTDIDGEDDNKSKASDLSKSIHKKSSEMDAMIKEMRELKMTYYRKYTQKSIHEAARVYRDPDNVLLPNHAVCNNWINYNYMHNLNNDEVSARAKTGAKKTKVVLPLPGYMIHRHDNFSKCKTPIRCFESEDQVRYEVSHYVYRIGFQLPPPPLLPLTPQVASDSKRSRSSQKPGTYLLTITGRKHSSTA